MTVNKIIDSSIGPGIKAVFCVWFNPYGSKFTYVDFYDYTLEKTQAPSPEQQEERSDEGEED